MYLILNKFNYYYLLLLLGTAERGVVDCRTEGCGKNAECLREHAFFVCRCLPGTSGRPEIECFRGKSPIFNTLTPIHVLHTLYNIDNNLMQYIGLMPSFT